jgi:hypothetical protein
LLSTFVALTPSVLCLSANTSNAGDTVSIELLGEIEAECQLTSINANVDLGQISGSGSQNLVFGIHCNAPFSTSLRSREGGLKHAGGISNAPGFTSLIPYTAQITIPTDAGVIANQCASADLTETLSSCPDLDSGNGIAIEQTGTLMVSWSADDELLAGTYSDVITLNVGVSY